MQTYTPVSRTAVILFLIAITVTNWGQNAPDNIYQISLKNRSFTPEKINTVSKESFSDNQNLLIQFDDVLNIEQKNEIENAGFLINGKISSTTISVGPSIPLVVKLQTGPSVIPEPFSSSIRQ